MIEKIKEQLRSGELKKEVLVDFFNACLEGKVEPSEAVELLKEFSNLEDLNLIKVFIEAEVETGVKLEWPDSQKPIVDKHSTGGVGDKVSLIVVPWIASTGLRVAKLSGRALGHTGGTIDKLESIPGVSTSLESEKFVELVIKNGCLIAEPSKNICPVESYLYDLRNRTGLVPFLPLVVASILSKKIATNADLLIFDVKTGKGAFFQEKSEATKLANALVAVAKLFGKKASALITSMENPLGYAVGNALEVLEAIDFLSGANVPGLNEVAYAVATQALLLAGFDEEEALIRLESARRSGKALNQFVKMVASLGGPDTLDGILRRIPRAPVVGTLTSNEKGYLHHVDPLLVSKAVKAASKDLNRPDTGIKLLVAPGDEISVDSELCEIHAFDYESLDSAIEILENAFLIDERKPQPLEYVFDRIS